MQGSKNLSTEENIVNTAALLMTSKQTDGWYEAVLVTEGP